MNNEKLFKLKHFQQNKQLEYLGSDCLPISESYNLYLKKCSEFKAKAKKYAQDNLHLKTSLTLHNKYGYESCQEFEEEVLVERDKYIADFEKTFDVSLFDGDPNSMYECFFGQGKRIRLIRDINTGRDEEFSKDFEKKKSCWFTRYCNISRFIQAARTIIIQNRLQKNLAILKTLTPGMIRNIEREIARDQRGSFKDLV